MTNSNSLNFRWSKSLLATAIIILALALGGCTTTDNHGVTVEQETPIIGPLMNVLGF